MTKFGDLPDVLRKPVDTKELAAIDANLGTVEAAAPLRANKDDVDTTLTPVICRVFGKPGVPALVDLGSRSVYPVKE